MATPHLESLDQDQVWILDGATGTELQRRGFEAPLPLWTGNAALRAPDLLGAIHREYLEAGADIVTANTFRTHPYTLRQLGREEDAARLTTQTVAVARQACNQVGRGLVAGSIAPVEDCYHPERVPATEILLRDHAAHAHNLVEAGVDLLLVETMNTSREARTASKAALATGLPVLVSLIPDPKNTDTLLSGEDLEMELSLLRALAVDGARIAGFLVNCVPAQVALSVLERMQRHSDPRPVGAYANWGKLEDPNGWAYDLDTPVETFGEWAVQCRDLGARILGGCCGTTPDHIHALAQALGRGS